MSMPQALAPPDCVQVQTGGTKFQESDQAGLYPSSASTHCLTSGKPLPILDPCRPFSEMDTVASKGLPSLDTATGSPAGKEEKINTEGVGCREFMVLNFIILFSIFQTS